MLAEDSFLEDLKRAILDTASRCRNCNYCFTICPVFKSARGFASQTPSGMLQSINYALKWNMFRERKEKPCEIFCIFALLATDAFCSANRSQQVFLFWTPYKQEERYLEKG